MLAETSRAILAFERSWFLHLGAKEQAVHERFGMSLTRYYQALNAVLDDPEALAYDALTVKRLRRLRGRRQVRSARRVGFEVGPVSRVSVTLRAKKI